MGGSGGGVRSGVRFVGGARVDCEQRIEVFVKILKKYLGSRGGVSGWM